MANKIMRGVYCVDIDFKAVPKCMQGKMMIVKREVESVPIALDENFKPISRELLLKHLKIKNIDDYVVSYAIKNKKYLSNTNY
jgi:hypothetical protein